MFLDQPTPDDAAAQAAWWGKQAGGLRLQIPKGAPLLPDDELRRILARFEELNAEFLTLNRKLRDDRRLDQARAEDRAAAGAAAAAGKPLPDPTAEPAAVAEIAADTRRRDALRAALDQLDGQAADIIAKRGDAIRQQLNAEAAEHLAVAADAARKAAEHLAEWQVRAGLAAWTHKRRGGNVRPPVVPGLDRPADKVIRDVVATLSSP